MGPRKTRWHAGVVAIALGALLVAAGCDPQATSATAQPGASGASTASSRAQTIPGPDPVTRIERLERALDNRDQKIRELEALIAARDAVLEDMSKGVAALAQRLDEVERRAEGERQSLESEIAQLRAREADLRGKFDEYARLLEALRQQSLLPNSVREVPKIDARVLLVERGADGPVVLLDAGRKQGVEPGYEFRIARGGKPIALVEVARVDAQTASARVLSVVGQEQIREGDAATTRTQ